MKYKDIISTLNSIEENVPIGSIEFQGLKIWPIIRLELWKILNSRFKYSTENSAGKKSLIKNLLEKIKAYTGFIFYKLNPNKYEPAAAVFLIARLERTVQVEGKYFSRFSNSLKEILESLGKRAVTLDLSSKKKPVWGETYFIDKEKIFSRKKKEDIKNWDVLEKYLNENFPQIKLDKNLLVNIAEATLGYHKIFERILSKIKPKICFLECYYHPTGWGYILACRKLGIKTVEIQHGEQHGMYRGWSNVPKEGYQIMPHLWWCWGEESAREINRWSGKMHPEHKAFVGGNPWITRLASLNKKENTPKIKNKNIVVAIPNKDYPLEHLFEAVKKSSSSIQWLVSIHPMKMKDGNFMEKVRGEFEKTGNKNVWIQDDKISFYDFLVIADFLVTPWSTAVYEALAFGTHPILINGDNKEVFKHYVDKGHFSFADTADKILEVIGKNKSEFNFKEETPYIEADREKMGVILKDLLK